MILLSDLKEAKRLQRNIIKKDCYLQCMLKYGIITILYVLRDHEYSENYEECGIIISAIEEVNNRLDNSNIEQLPYTLTGLNVKDFLNASYESFSQVPYAGTFTPEAFFTNVDYYMECVKNEIDKIK
jgi:hypothetical protein